MNEKIVVDVTVPILGRRLEFNVPPTMKLEMVKQLMTKIISAVQPGFDSEQEKLWLLDIGRRSLLPSEMTCMEAGVENGSRLMLITVE